MRRVLAALRTLSLPARTRCAGTRPRWICWRNRFLFSRWSLRCWMSFRGFWLAPVCSFRTHRRAGLSSAALDFFRRRRALLYLFWWCPSVFIWGITIDTLFWIRCAIRHARNWSYYWTFCIPNNAFCWAPSRRTSAPPNKICSFSRIMLSLACLPSTARWVCWVRTASENQPAHSINQSLTKLVRYPNILESSLPFHRSWRFLIWGVGCWTNGFR